jgi:7,8-dihydroneopterin aldolase/epimerase/oxygenase
MKLRERASMTAGEESGAIWDASRDHVRATLRNVVVEVQVGLHPWEQHPERPSRLIVNVDMYAALPARGVATTRDNMIDYDPVRSAIMAWRGRPHVPFLEDLVEELITVCFANPRVEACRVSVVKPDIFNEADAAGIEIYRRRPAGY